MTHLPHGMKELRYAELSEPGMKSCQDCERRMTIRNGVGSVKCSEGIIAGVIFHNQGCSLMNCVRNNSRVLFVTPNSKLAFQPQVDLCENCNHPIDNETNQDEQCEKCGKKICSSCCVLHDNFKVLCKECNNPAANKNKDDSLSSLKPGDYIETEKDRFYIIYEVTNSKVNYIRYVVGGNKVSISSVPKTDFFQDMAYYGFTKKDGSIFDVGFKFDLPNANEEYTIKNNINQFDTGITFHSSASYTTTVSREEVIERIIKGVYVPQFNSNKDPEIKAGDIYEDDTFRYFINKVDQKTNIIEYDMLDVRNGHVLKSLWLDQNPFLGDIKNGLMKKIS